MKMSKIRNLTLTNADYELKPIGYGYNVAVLVPDEDNCGGCSNGEHCGSDQTSYTAAMDGCCCARVDLTDVTKVDGNNRKWKMIHDREADAETYRSAKQAVEAIDANLSAYLVRRDDYATGKPTGSRIHATHRGGRSLIPGWSLKDAFSEAAERLAADVAAEVDNGATDDVYSLVEGALMDATEDDSAARLEEGATGAYLVSELGKVLNEYLRQNRNDRYEYILRKVHQSTGRVLDKMNRDRKTGTKIVKGGK